MYCTYLLPKIYTLLFLLLMLPAIAMPQGSPVATILAAQGSVEIIRLVAGENTMQQVKLVSGSGLFNGDVVKTKASGRLVLGLPDGSQAIISENTTVEIKDTNSSPRTIFNVLRGKTRIKIEKLGGKPNPYRITTPTTVIAVRGTEFDVFVKGDRTEVFVTEGEVSVTNLLTPTREVFLLPGQFTRVEKDAPPREPETFKPSRNDDNFRERRDDNDNRGNSDGGDRNNRDRDERDSRDEPGNRDNRERGTEPDKRNNPAPTDSNRDGGDRPARRPGDPESAAGSNDTPDNLVVNKWTKLN